MEVHEFTVDGITYTVRMWHDHSHFYVRAFCDNKPVNPFTYQVSFEKNYDYFVLHGSPGKEVLLEQATADIHEGRIYGVML
ncbi:MAG: hypothetical protein AAGA64_16760 [Bacteroidota bacterium]